MASETPVSGRPRPALLIVLALAVGALVLTRMWPTGAAPAAVPASAQVRQVAQRSQGNGDAADLDVRLDALAAPRPEPGRAERNPFRFGPPPPPPPPPRPEPRRPEPVDSNATTTTPLASAGPPPIPLKFIGLVEKEGMKVAAMSDCRTTYHGREGQIIDGRYRLVSIGVESIVLEYVDGRGRTTVRQDGCSPR